MQFASCGAGGCAVPGVRGAACGALHTLLEGDDDALYCCGWGLYGQVSRQGVEGVVVDRLRLTSKTHPGTGTRRVAALRKFWVLERNEWNSEAARCRGQLCTRSV